jgi:aminoglycoside phosphotransferase (APT) family kinase protein
MNAGAAPAVGAAIAEAAAALGLARPAVAPLPGGVANRSYRLRAGEADLVLKVASGAAASLGASLRAEVAMQSLAAGAGLAPPIVLAPEARGFIVSRHAPGRVPSARDMRDPRLLRRVGAWIAALHRLPLPQGLPVVDIGERAAGYLARALADRPDPFLDRLARTLDARRAELAAPARLAPCHHDLHRRNFLDDGQRLLVVDWEYAGPGDPAADLASCIAYHALEGVRAAALLDGYRATDTELARRVAALGWVFDCLWFGWNAVAALAGMAPDPREQARLAARLVP